MSIIGVWTRLLEWMLHILVAMNPFLCVGMMMYWRLFPSIASRRFSSLPVLRYLCQLLLRLSHCYSWRRAEISFAWSLVMRIAHIMVCRPIWRSPWRRYWRVLDLGIIDAELKSWRRLMMLVSLSCWLPVCRGRITTVIRLQSINLYHSLRRWWACTGCRMQIKGQGLSLWSLWQRDHVWWHYCKRRPSSCTSSTS